MEIRELRIGNYVSDLDGNILEIKLISSKEVLTKRDSIKRIGGNLLIESINPIPLTEEILLKFGFYFEDGFYCLRINNTAFMTIILLGSYVNYELSNFRQKIVFSRGEFSGVHQLQNLYFSLKGEELTFKN